MRYPCRANVCQLGVCPGLRLEAAHLRTNPVPTHILVWVGSTCGFWGGGCGGEGAASDVMSLPLISAVTLTGSLSVV